MSNDYINALLPSRTWIEGEEVAVEDITYSQFHHHPVEPHPLHNPSHLATNSRN
jgi:hypothetical protein